MQPLNRIAHHREMELLARAALGVLQLRLPNLAFLSLGLAENEGAAPQILGLIGFVVGQKDSPVMGWIDLSL